MACTINHLRVDHRVTGGYGMVWDALQLRPDSRVPEALHLAQLRSPGRDLAVEWLLRRPDAFELLVESLGHPDETRQGIGYLLARDMHPADPRLPSVLIDHLALLSLDPLPDVAPGIVSRGRAQCLLLLIAEQRLATPEILSTLRSLQRKLARHDDFLTDCVRIVLRELSTSQTPPPPLD